MEDKEAPLSPVLNNSRRNLKLIAKRKSKLRSKYSQSSSSESQEVVQLSQLSNISSQNINSASPEKETNSLEDRLKRCKNAQNNKKFCYDIASNSSKCTGEINPDLAFKGFSKPLPDNSTILQESVNIGFKLSSGKDIKISDRSLNRAHKLFEDIIEDNIPLSSSVKSQQSDKNEILSTNTQITDTQMCSAAENAECLLDLMDNWDISPQNKENNSFMDDFEISTQETNRLFSDITQNILNHKTDKVTSEVIEIADNKNVFFGFSEEDILVSLQISAINRECVNQIDQKIHFFTSCIKNETNLFKKPNVPFQRIFKKSLKRLEKNENKHIFDHTHKMVTRFRNKSSFNNDNLFDSQNMPSTSKNALKMDILRNDNQNKSKNNRKRSRNIFEGIDDLNYEEKQQNFVTMSPCSNFSTLEKKLIKTKNIFKDIETLGTTDLAIVKPGDNDFLCSSKSVDNEIFLDKTQIIFPDNFKNATFATASGKKCAVSEENLKKAKNIFQDIEDLENTVYGMEMPADKLKNDNFSTFSFVDNERNIERAKNIFPDNLKNATFATASGKKCALSEKNLKKAKNIFQDIEDLDNAELDIKDFKNKEKNMFKDIENLDGIPSFSTGSGKKCTVSEKDLKRARNIFEDVEKLEYNDFNHNVENGEEFILLSTKNISEDREHASEEVRVTKTNTPTVKLKNNKKMSVSSPNLRFNSPINTSNTSTPILRNTLASKSAKKRSLGLSSTMCRQIDISENQIKRAKLNFEDLDSSNNNTSDLSQKFDKNPIEIWDNNIVKSKEVEKQKNAADTTITNEDLKHLITVKPNLEFKSNGNDYCFQEMFNINSKNYFSNFEERIAYLEKETSVIKLRMHMFKQQQSLITNPNVDYTRQRRGVLFATKNKNNPNRLSVHKYIRNQRNLNSSSTNRQEKITIDYFFLEVTSKNALNLQLHVPWWSENNTELPPTIKTADEAIVIPNHLNYVGVTEIQNAVLTMPGVDAKLVPNTWVQNHFKWIVWKLVTMERMFPDCFKGCLNVGNIVDQLKYRYDVEIDGINGRPQRSALKMILQKDDVSTRRIVLSVASIDRLPGNRHELELTDGWYGIKTTIDNPLHNLVTKKLIQIGTKLTIHGALLNCEECCPLEIPDTTRLQVHYNCTKKSPFDAKLGFTYNPNPFNISLRCIAVNGGPVSLTSGYIARIYPVSFLETYEGSKIWRNKKAEQVRANIWERDQGMLIERIRAEVEKELEMEYFDKNKGKMNRTKVLLKDIFDVTDVVTLFDLLEESNDPDSLKELLTADQCRNLQEYQMKLQMERQSEMTAKIAAKLSSTNMQKRNVSSVIRLLLLDMNSPNHYRFFSFWRPTETHLQILKEGVAVNLYNIDIRNNSHLCSSSRTQFELLSDVQTAKYLHYNRSITPIEILAKPFLKPNFSEFDTIGLIVEISIETTNQCIWLVNNKMEFLAIRIREGPQTCSVIDNLKEGQFLTVLNLIYQKKVKKYVSAEGNLYTVFSTTPPSYYKTVYDEICATFDKDISEYLQKCQGIIELHDCEANLLNNMRIASNISFNTPNNKEMVETLTASDEEMSLIDTQFY